MTNPPSDTWAIDFILHKSEPYIPAASAANALPMSSLLSDEPATPFWFALTAIVVFLFWLWLVARTSQA